MEVSRTMTIESLIADFEANIRAFEATGNTGSRLVEQWHHAIDILRPKLTPKSFEGKYQKYRFENGCHLWIRIGELNDYYVDFLITDQDGDAELEGLVTCKGAGNWETRVAVGYRFESGQDVNLLARKLKTTWNLAHDLMGEKAEYAKFDLAAPAFLVENREIV